MRDFLNYRFHFSRFWYSLKNGNLDFRLLFRELFLCNLSRTTLWIKFCQSDVNLTTHFLYQETIPVMLTNINGVIEDNPDAFDLIEWVLFDENTESYYELEVDEYYRSKKD